MNLIHRLPTWVIDVGDLHVNSTLGLCPPSVQLDDGGTYLPSPTQRWLLECWHEFWDIVAKLRGRKVVVMKGDAVESFHHGTVQIVTGNDEVQFGMALQVLEHPAEIADEFHVLRGTPTHTGPVGFWEEKLAKDLGAIPDQDAGTASWWHLAKQWDGFRFDLAHHPQTSSRRPWTKDAAAARQAAITWDEYAEIGELPPHVVGRAHVHYFAQGFSRGTYGYFSPPWQACTAFGRRLGAGRRIEPIGGIIFECKRGESFKLPRDIRFSPKRRPAWT